MKLSLHLVTWNGAKYIPMLFDSLKKQTFKDWKLVILDNASSDNTVEKIKTELQDFPFEHELIINGENKGFAGGHTQLYKSCTSNYFLIINQDLYLEGDCIEKMVKFMDENFGVAAVSPRLMRWDFSADIDDADKLKQGFTDQIDSLGLHLFRNRRVVESHTGEFWSTYKLTNLQTYTPEVFGVSGAIVLFRKKAIDEIGFLDESFQSYKEDVDLAFRLNSAGWKSAVLYGAVAYHDRSAAGPKEHGDRSAIENKKKQSELVKYHSYKNHLMTLYKNEYWQNFLLDFPWILWYELKKLVYFILFDRKVLKGLMEIWRLRKALRDKRYEIRDRRKIGWREIRKI
ncbi:MAG: glycosyltransferase family 2 protein [Candidatus Magasanikbacteria bacterium]|nr:glycosyltransferase family 2 protein [Candidatus Magasanikbacteria bacterium]